MSADGPKGERERAVLPSVVLATPEHMQQGSPKIYSASIRERSGGYEVVCAFARVGWPANVGLLTPHPLSLDEALRVFHENVSDKQRRGYVVAEPSPDFALPDMSAAKPRFIASSREDYRGMVASSGASNTPGNSTAKVRPQRSALARFESPDSESGKYLDVRAAGLLPEIREVASRHQHRANVLEPCFRIYSSVATVAATAQVREDEYRTFHRIASALSGILDPLPVDVPVPERGVVALESAAQASERLKDSIFERVRTDLLQQSEIVAKVLLGQLREAPIPEVQETRAPALPKPSARTPTDLIASRKGRTFVDLGVASLLPQVEAVAGRHRARTGLASTFARIHASIAAMAASAHLLDAERWACRRVVLALPRILDPLPKDLRLGPQGTEALVGSAVTLESLATAVVARARLKATDASSTTAAVLCQQLDEAPAPRF